MTREEFDRWQLERKLVDDLLRQIEQVQRRILTDLDCPIDPAKIDAMLNRNPAAPWPARTRRRIVHARHALVHSAHVRRETGSLDTGSPRLAAYHALLAGIYAGDAATRTAIAAQEHALQCKGGRRRGEQKAKEARCHDLDIARCAKQWRDSDELQFKYGYRSPVRYIRATVKPRLNPRTIRRVLARLRTGQ